MGEVSPGAKFSRRLSVGMIPPVRSLLDDYRWNLYACKAWVRLHQRWVFASYLSRWFLQYNSPYVHMITNGIRMLCKTRVRFHRERGFACYLTRSFSSVCFYVDYWRYFYKSRVRFHCGRVLARILEASKVRRSFPPFWLTNVVDETRCFQGVRVLQQFTWSVFLVAGSSFFFLFADCSEFGTPYLSGWHVVCFVLCLYQSLGGRLINFCRKILFPLGVTSKANRFSANVIWVVLFRVSIFWQNMFSERNYEFRVVIICVLKLHWTDAHFPVKVCYCGAQLYCLIIVISINLP